MPYSTHEELERLGIGKKIRTLREQKRMSLEELSAKVKVTRVLLSQIEDDVVTPTVAALLNLSKVLGVGIDYFFTQAETVEKIELTRANERLSVLKSRETDSTRLTYNYQALSYRLTGKKMEPFFIEFDTETDEKLEPQSHSGEEFLYCLDGEIEFITSDRTIRLRPGDALYFFSETPHVLRGIGAQAPKALAVLLPGEKEEAE